MNVKTILSLAGLSVSILLIGCDSDSTNDSNVTDQGSLLIKKDNYKGIPFTVRDSEKTNVKLTLLNNIPVDAYVISEGQYISWQNQTQNNMYVDIKITSYHNLLNITDHSETGWMSISNGNYYLLIENTIFGVAKPSSINVTGSSSIKYSVLHKGEF